MIQAQPETGAPVSTSVICLFILLRVILSCKRVYFNMLKYDSLCPYCFWLRKLFPYWHYIAFTHIPSSTYRVPVFIFKCLIHFGFYPSVWGELQAWLFPYGYPIILTPLIKRKKKSLHTDFWSRLSHIITFQMQLDLFLDILWVSLVYLFIHVPTPDS